MSTRTREKIREMAEEARLVTALTQGTAEDVKKLMEGKLLDYIRDEEEAISVVLVAYYSDNPHKVEVLRYLREYQPELENVDEYDLEADSGEAREVLQGMLDDWYAEFREENFDEAEWEEWQKERQRQMEDRRAHDRMFSY